MKFYVKPTLFCEQFELSQHIASCDMQAHFNNFDDRGSCSATVPGSGFDAFPIFNDGVSGCALTELEGFCVFNGGDGVTIFAS